MDHQPHIRRLCNPQHQPTPTGRRFVLGITGASGADYALRVLDLLLTAGNEVHLVVTDFGRRLLADECAVQGLDLADLLPHLADNDFAIDYRSLLVVHPNKDVGAVIASGSFLHDGMVILPCSSTTLGSIANGSGSNLLTRAAAVTLKERRPLIVCHRETPLSLIDINNMQAITHAGGIIAPTNPGLYLHPETIADLVDFIAGKALDLLKVEHSLATRWSPHATGH